MRRLSTRNGQELAIAAVCINASRWDSTLEGTGDANSRLPVRLGMNMVKGLANAHGAAIVATRGQRPFASIDDLWRRAGVPQDALVRLAEADAFRGDHDPLPPGRPNA